MITSVHGARLKALRVQIDEALANLAPPQDTNDRVAAAMRYALISPGKRIRPLLTLITAAQLGRSTAEAMPAACALELVHAASLVLDDLPCMDDADERRGRPTTHRRFGEDVAVLAGVGLLNEAYALIGGAHHVPADARCEMVSLLSRTVGPGGLIGGQDRDLMGCEAGSLDDLRDMHQAKTGVLFVAAVEMGALVAGAGADAREALRQCACELGLAFQALDDLQDEAELEGPRPGSNLLSMLSKQGARDEAANRMERARQALMSGPPQLAAMGGYLDLLVSPLAA